MTADDLLVFGTVASLSAGPLQHGVRRGNQQQKRLGFCGEMWGWPPMEAGEAGREKKIKKKIGDRFFSAFSLHLFFIPIPHSFPCHSLAFVMMALACKKKKPLGYRLVNPGEPGFTALGVNGEVQKKKRLMKDAWS